MDSPSTPDRASSRIAALERMRAAIDWRSALREFVVIVAGVLVALAAQAWWQGREQRAREAEYLRQLLADTRENARRIDRAIAEDSVTGRSLYAMVGALYGSEAPLQADSVRRWLRGRAFSASDLQPLTGSYTALLTSGDLRIIETDTLRSQLVAYAAMLESGREKLQFFFGQAFNDPGRMVRVVPSMRLVFLEPKDVSPRAARRWERDLTRLRDDDELAALLFALQAANRNRQAHLAGMRDKTGRLLRAIEAEPNASAPSDSVAVERR